MAGTIVQSVATSANAASGVTLSISSTTAGNLLIIAAVMTNTTSTLSVAFTGTTQTTTALEHPVNANSQSQAWIVPNCASGTTAVTVSRNSGTGQFSGIVIEVSGEITSPLDQHTSLASQAIVGGATTGISTGTTGATTQATEFEYAIFAAKENDTTHNAAPTYSALSAGWTQDKTSGSTAATPNTNVSIYGASRVVSSTGTANATSTVTLATGAVASNDACGIVATFEDAGGATTNQVFSPWINLQPLIVG